MAAEDVPFDRIGGYRVLRRLATGGTSDVLLARAEGPHGFERTVVLKLLLRQYQRDAPMEKMFAREAAAYARLSHPAIVKLYDFFTAEGQLIMVLEFIDGLPLNRFRALLRKSGEQLDDRASIFVASRVFAALAAAHGARDPETGEFAPVIHRDVNPSNVLLPWDGHVKLADFGIAKVAGTNSDTQTGLIKGTYGYMSPEQVRGEPVTVRTDVYAASLLLWELLARRKAIQRGALPEQEILRAMADPSLPSLDVLRPDLPQRLRDVVARGLQPSPEARSTTADEMLIVLRESVTSNEGRNALADMLTRAKQVSEAVKPPAIPGAPNSRPVVVPPLPIPTPAPSSVTSRDLPRDPGSREAPAPRPQSDSRPDTHGDLPLMRGRVPTAIGFPAPQSGSGNGAADGPSPPNMFSLPTSAPPEANARPAGESLLPVVGLSGAPAASAAAPGLQVRTPAPPPPPPVVWAALVETERQSTGSSPPSSAPLSADRTVRTAASPASLVSTPQVSPAPSLAEAARAARSPLKDPARLMPIIPTPRPSRADANSTLRAVPVGGGMSGTYVLVTGIALVASAAVVAALLFARPKGVKAKEEATKVTVIAPAIPTATPPATATSAPPPVAAAPADPSTPPAPAGHVSTLGSITSPARGHRIFVDGHYAGDSPGPVRVKCGTHSVKIGSGGASHTVQVPCGGEVSVR